MEWLTLERWSPYAAGIGIGLLSCVAFLLSDRPLGCSSAFARTSGMMEKLFRGERVAERVYYKKYTPTIEWEWMLVVGIFFGALLSAKLSCSFHTAWVPEKWTSAFGSSAGLRWIVSFLGGIIMGLGARWAGGCTSGHGISGTLQLAVSSWLAVMGFFAGGIASAMVLYRLF